MSQRVRPSVSQRCFIFKRNKIVDTQIGGKNKITIWGIRYLIWRLDINLLKWEFYHSVTIVPVNPIAFHSSAMRFSAFRLISSERLKRARASSYVTFFISITLMYLTFDAAKLQIKSEITSKTKEKPNLFELYRIKIGPPNHWQSHFPLFTSLIERWVLLPYTRSLWWPSGRPWVRLLPSSPQSQSVDSSSSFLTFLARMATE